MSGDQEIKKLKKDLAKNREEIADLQRRIQALILKRRGESPDDEKGGKKLPPSNHNGR